MDKVIRTIYESELQSAAEANLGRELTEAELKKVPTLVIDNADLYDGIYSGLISVARDAT